MAKAAAEKRTVYEIVTDRIVDALEKGTVPWRKTWKVAGASSLPRNLVSKKVYRGINLLILSMSPYACPYWLTFNQARNLGGSVRKGSKGTPVFFWSVKDAKPGDKDENGNPIKKRFISRYYTVFNLEQCDGIDAPAAKSTEPTVEIKPIDKCEAVAAAYLKHGPSLSHGGDRACYIPVADAVNMPTLQSFGIAEEYYSTLFHEFVHSTGHEKRLGRFDNTRPPAPYGSPDYGREELVAEMGAAFVCAHTGISNAVIENQTAYVAGWLRTIKEDRRAAVYAAASAAKAADMILGEALSEEDTADE